MFSYFGSKSKIVKHYPAPTLKTIIEPFAGAAWYSLTHYAPDVQVILCDKNPIIAGLWRWMIRVTPQEALAIPEPKPGDDIRELPICQEVRWWLGFWINHGSSSPRNIATEWSVGKGKETRIPFAKQRLADFCLKIRHWKILEGDWFNIPNQLATWFIDPPYQFGGSNYVYNAINYKRLAHWAKSRRGQVVVCEGEGADWMQFSPLIRSGNVSAYTRKRRGGYSELMWYRAYPLQTKETN